MKDLVPVDRLTPEQMAEPYTVESLAKAGHEIQYLEKKMTVVSKASLIMAFEMGKRLVAVKATLDHGQFLPWLAENFPSTHKTASNYMRLYQRFKDDPWTLLGDISMHQAYVEAGIKKATSQEEEDSVGPLKVAGQTDPAAEAANMVEVFRKKTLSGKPLKNHRVENLNGRIYVYRKDVGTVSPAMDLYLGRPRGLPDPDWMDMQLSFAIATELYLLKVEEYEERGVVPAPEDNRLLNVMAALEQGKLAVDEPRKRIA